MSYFVLRIQYIDGSSETRNIAAPVTTLGRESGDVVLRDPQTSSRHAEIHFQSGRVTVRDTGSTNGTWVNGQRQSEFVLQPGQVFYCGQTMLQLVQVQGFQAKGPSGTVLMSAPLLPPETGPMPAPVPQAQNPAWGAPPMNASQPQPGYGSPLPPGYGSPLPPGYGSPLPQPGFGSPPPQSAYGSPPPQFGHGSPPPQSAYGSPAPQFGHGSPQPQASDATLMSPSHRGASVAGAPPLPPPGAQPAEWSEPPAPPRGGPPIDGAEGAHAAPGGPPMQVAPSAGVHTNFQGSGGDLFVTLLVGGLLTLLTLGVYLPWFVCKMARYVLTNTTLGPTGHGELKLEFTGKGGELFVTLFVGALLTGLTLGIYAPWFLCKQLRYFADNTWATARDGTRFRLRFEGKGEELLVTMLLGYLLNLVTLGIYAPWFVCKLLKAIYARTTILENEQPVGSFDFDGKGGELFLTALLGFLLVLVTVGIYLPWLQVKVYKFFAAGTRVTYQGRVFGGQFVGTGGEFLGTFVLGVLLTIVTVYIYFPWFLVKLWKFKWNKRVFQETDGERRLLAGERTAYSRA